MLNRGLLIRCTKMNWSVHLSREDSGARVWGLGNEEVGQCSMQCLSQFHWAKQKCHSPDAKRRKAAFSALSARRLRPRFPILILECFAGTFRWGHPVAWIFPKYDVGTLIQRRRISVDPGLGRRATNKPNNVAANEKTG